MAKLISFHEWQVGMTDFGDLHADQILCGAQAFTGLFASTCAGSVAMRCGSKYAAAEVRLELWDGRPPRDTDHFEEWDGLPWRTVPTDRAVVQVTGWGGEGGPGDNTVGLHLNGMTEGRVDVYASGRARYGYDHLEGLGSQEPEKWQLRWWPDSEGIPEMLRPPRRVSQAYSRHFELMNDLEYLAASSLDGRIETTPRQIAARMGSDLGHLLRLLGDAENTLAWDLAFTRYQDGALTPETPIFIHG
jgi:hypothetical protein